VNLRIRVNDELVLDAGTVEDIGVAESVIHPPKDTLLGQVLDYLRSKPDPPCAPTTVSVQNEGAAAAAIVLRWGSYLAVLADTAKPIWSEARLPRTSRVSDAEMARINIEASAALAEWIDIARVDPIAYKKLVARALAYLPLPKTRSRRVGADFAMLALPSVAAKIVEATDADRVARVRGEAQAHPTRLFANALVNVAWRNGPVEIIHAGACGGGYPLDRRRVTVAEERTLMAFAADRLTIGMGLCRDLAVERPARSWPEQVLPYGLAGMMLITPTGWTLTEATRQVRLPHR
jgi:hypothetical protein